MKINFIKTNKITIPISILLCILSLTYIYKYNFNLGLEFTGGIEIELASQNKIDLINLKNELQNIKNLKIKYYGSKKNIQIKLKHSNEKTDTIVNAIKNKLPQDITIIKIDYIGAEINKETIKNSITAIFVAIIAMALYLTYRFKYKLAISAILALIHDMLIITGLISFLHLEFDLTILSAIFAVFGYSINDTVVVFDRLREYSILHKNTKNLEEIINLSINSTLSRTLITSLSTLLVTTILIFFAGEHLFGFSLVLTLGIIIGTYSSIYISTMPLLVWKKFNKSKLNNYS